MWTYRKHVPGRGTASTKVRRVPGMLRSDEKAGVMTR